MESYYVFREAKNRKELESLLRLRYQNFTKHRTASFIPKNWHGIDLDTWDQYARHWGLFENDKNPVGYIRIIEDLPTWSASLVSRIAESCGIRFEKNGLQPPFPTMSYYPDSKPLFHFWESCKKKSHKMVEASRLTLDRKNCSLKMALKLVEGFISVYLLGDFSYGMVSCIPRHASLYNKLYKSNPFPGTHDFEAKGIPASVVVVGGGGGGGEGEDGKLNYLTSLPSSTADRLQLMAESYQNRSSIIFSPQNSPILLLPNPGIAA